MSAESLLHVLHPGLHTTVQDAGRNGWRHLGIARAGALDPSAAAIANHLVGNGPDAAVLELPMHGPIHNALLAIGGSAISLSATDAY